MSSSMANLSLDDPQCNSDACPAFLAAHKASQATVSYAWQYEYGHWVTWCYLIVIALFTALYLLRRIREAIWRFHKQRNLQRDISVVHPSSNASRRASLLDRALALGRTVSYRRYHGRWADRLGLPSAGMQLLMVGTLIFALAASFAVRPYYRDHRGYGSPPLGVRTGLMAIALTPIIVALAGKVNFVTWLTGVSYEKLNVLHRYLSYVALLLSIIHTVPFLVAPLCDGGPAALARQFYKPGAFEYNGTPALALLVFLCGVSIPWIRARAYECFVASHYLGAFVYLALMFWHAGNEMDSWAYLWATLALMLASMLVRVFYKHGALDVRAPWCAGYPTTVHCLSDDMVKLSVSVPPSFHWGPGQHCFLRMPQLSIWDSHPFTIASAPLTNSTTRSLVFLVRAHHGFTSRLCKCAPTCAAQCMRTIVEGPYGGVKHSIELQYDQVLLIVGGGGITSALSWLNGLIPLMTSPQSQLRHIKLLWMVHRAEHIQWAQSMLEDIKGYASPGSLDVEIHITQTSSSQANASPDGSIFDIEKGKALGENNVPQQSSSNFGQIRIADLGAGLWSSKSAKRSVKYDRKRAAAYLEDRRSL